jgi:hypothetical protein
MVVLDFTYTQQDCLRAWRRHYLEKLNIPLDLVGMALLAGFGLLKWHANGLVMASVVPLLLGGSLALIVGMALFAIPHPVYRRSQKLKQAYHLKFSEDGIEFNTDSLESRLD